MGYTESLAEFIVNLTIKRIPQNIIDQATAVKHEHQLRGIMPA